MRILNLIPWDVALRFLGHLHHMIRNSHGKFSLGLYNKLGYCSTTRVKLYACHIGIDMSHLNIKNIIFKIESLIVVNMVASDSSLNTFVQPLLEDVISFLHLNGWRTYICHVHGKTNLCVDLLASHIYSSLYFNCIFFNVFLPF